MKITASQSAPVFTVQDVNNVRVSLNDFKGKKVLLSFYRNVGCPICNLRFHEIQEQANYFREKNLVILAVYESSADNMKKYIGEESFFAVMIPNENLSLYKLYKIDNSMGKMMKGMFHGAMGKMNEGKKLFTQKIKQDGKVGRIGADFLIDEKGIVKFAYYGNHLGDHLPIADIKQFLN